MTRFRYFSLAVTNQMTNPGLQRFLISFFLIGASVQAQMVTTQAPFQSNSSSFYEYSHVGWGVQNPHYFINFNGGGALPPYGGYQPNAGLHTGFAVGNAHFDLGFGQGASFGSSTVSPMLTTTSGYPGVLFIGSERPYVTGVAPTVGSGFFSVPPMDPLTARMAAGEFRMENRRVVIPSNDRTLKAGGATLDRVANVQKIDEKKIDPNPAVGRAAPIQVKPAQSATTTQDTTAAQYFERAKIAEKEGRAGVAKIYYQLAAAKGDAVIKAQSAERLDVLKSGSNAKP